MNELRMHQRIIRQNLLVLCLLLSYNGVQGEKKLSKLEDMELEKQLKLLNKPAIKTVKTKYGDVYDCVDFYKQHAFDHPLLKDHKFHPKMKPTLPMIKQNSYASTTSRLSTIWSKDGGCPSGTVPIKRITKNDLIRQRDMPPPEPANFDHEFAGSNNNITEQKASYMPSYGYKRAMAKTPKDPNAKFTGGGMAASVYNPHVEGKQHSACRLRIQKGSDILQTGWRVDPTLYGDNKTRFFVHFQTGKTHCFNVLCPGFVQVNHDIPLDTSFDHISQRGVITWEIILYIYKDQVYKNWWVLEGQNYTLVGFWPHAIFTELEGFATNVDWGGVAYNPPGVPEPPMGSSYFPIENSTFDAYCRSIAVSNEEGDSVGIYNIVWLTENIFAYKVLFKTLLEGSNSFTYVLYGGPGNSPQV
ncbi:uncharacterized protein LOC129890794 [Solanum dulcamara]|uniref:uncharacterized protein LOC129890794 n=1 Tax=Solanum dulcamara TaxID=45834 RepID=UPI002486562B|nr:uncharacterized protein LOC129890794 [Solanum dulcamara]